MVRTDKITVTTTGSDGSAEGTGYGTYPMNGELFALYVDWAGTAPATSDIAVTVESDDNHPAVTLYSKDDSATDAWVYPVVQNTDTGGSAVTNEYQRILVAGRLKVVVAQSNALDPVMTVYVYVKE